MVIARGSKNIEYERVQIDEWIKGEIVEVQDRVNENRKYKDENGEWQVRTAEECRFKLDLEDYQYNHYSRWMTISTNKASNLYVKYLKAMFPDLEPEQTVDLDKLVGQKVKTMWDQDERNGNIYQFISKIRRLSDEPLNIVVEEDGKDDDGFPGNKEPLPSERGELKEDDVPF